MNSDAERPGSVDVEADARALIDALSRGDDAAIVRRLAEPVAKILTPDLLKTTWAGVVAQLGELEAVDAPRIARDGPITTAIATLRFARGALAAKIVYDPAFRVVGLLLVPPEALAEWSPPAYAREGAFEERAVTVGARPELPGVLTLPLGEGPFPAAVLVHGSGPSDADETIGPNKPFKDLAWGLASRGVAALRYVKRSRHAPIGIVTVEEEVIAAARAAVELCAREPTIDRERVVVVGHSQGGYLAPRIAAGSPAVAAIAVLAGSTRPLEDMLVEQLEYIASLGGPNGEGAAKLVPAALAFRARVRDPALAPGDALEVPPGAKLTGAYFLDLRGYEAGRAAAALGKPVFVAQGGRDYQVTSQDLAGWRAALPPFAIHEYPALDHLLRAGEGRSRPESYAMPGHVDETLIADLAQFILGLHSEG